MANHTPVLMSTLLTILITHATAFAQLGPQIDLAPSSVSSAPEPIIELIEQPSPETKPSTTIELAPAATATASSESKPLGLPRTIRSTEQNHQLGDNPTTTPLKLGKEFVRTVATLAGVLMLIFALAHFYKRLARTKGGLSGQIGAGGKAPAGLVEVLGRYPISSGMTLVVMRFDRKVLLLSHATPGRGKRSGVGSMQTLCEMSSPEEVASILGKVRDHEGDSISANFEKALHQAGNATDQEIASAMYQPSPGMHVQRPRRVAPGLVSNDEGDRLELTSTNDSPAASQVLRRRLGAMRRGN